MAVGGVHEQGEHLSSSGLWLKARCIEDSHTVLALQSWMTLGSRMMRTMKRMKVAEKASIPLVIRPCGLPPLFPSSLLSQFLPPIICLSSSHLIPSILSVPSSTILPSSLPSSPHPPEMSSPEVTSKAAQEPSRVSHVPVNMTQLTAFSPSTSSGPLAVVTSRKRSLLCCLRALIFLHVVSLSM